MSWRALWPVGICGLLTLACDGRGPGGDGGPPPGMCPEPEVVECASDVANQAPLDLTGTTDGAADRFGGSACGARAGGGAGAPDVAFQWTAPAAGRYDISTEGSTFDTLLSVRRGCAGEEVTCNDDISRMVLQSRVTVDLAECESIVIVVDGYDASQSGAVQVHIGAHESLCDDGVDNDADGQADCDDPDCFSLACAGDDWPADWQAFEWEVLALTNQRRAEGADCDTEGMFGPTGPLEMDSVIQQAARGHCLDMGMQGYFEHDSLDGRSFADRMSEVGFRGAPPWGENIAAGQTTPAGVVQSWIDSDGHCANIMNPSYTVMGVGYAYVDQSPFGHYWVQDFAGSH